MTELQINQLLHEKVMGKCWHHIELRDDGNLVRAYCVKCETFGVDDNWVDYFSWADYGPMLEECMKKEWFSDFAYEWDDRWIGWIREYLFNPLNGTTAIAEFVVDNPQYFKGE